MADENEKSVAMNISLARELRDKMEEIKELLGVPYIEQIERGLALYHENLDKVLKEAKKVK